MAPDRQIFSPQALLGVGDRFPFGVGVGVAAQDHPARSLADQFVVEHDNRAIGLIAPRFGAPFHLEGGGDPAAVWVATQLRIRVG